MIYLCFTLLLLGLWLYMFVRKTTNEILNTPPQNNPKAYLGLVKDSNKQSVIVNIGDSITHGVVSHNYSKIVEKEVAKYGYKTINAGINADLAYTVLQRIDDIVACQPKIVTVLIGTNDVMATFGNRVKEYWKFKRIPKGQAVSLDFYSTNLTAIIKKLKTIPNVKIFVSSLPVLGEDLSSKYNDKIVTYSECIKRVSDEEGIYYLPLNEAMRAYLTQNPNDSALEFGKEQTAAILAIIRNRYLGQDWSQISERNNLQLTTETIHLNEKGANMVADVILENIAPLLSE